MNILETIHNKAISLMNIYPQWRAGQALFNALYLENEAMANKIRGTEYDCFYSDKNIPAFTKRVKELLNEYN